MTRPKTISHVGVAVKDLESRVAFYRDILGLELIHEEVVADQKVRAAMLRLGESTLELLSPTDETSPVAKFLAKRGEGIHHLALSVTDIEARLEELAAAGVRLIDRSPRAGAHGKKVAFIHPESTGGVLLELCE